MAADRARNNPLSGMIHFLRGFRLVLQPGVKRYVLIPLGINVVLFAAAIVGGAALLGDIVQGLQAVTPGWLDWLAWLLWPVLILATLVLAFYVISLLANLVAAPFMGPLAAAVERNLAGQGPAEASRPAVPGLLGEAITDLGMEVQKLGYFALRAGPLLLLFLIPGVNIIAPFLWLVFTAWSLALEYLDPSLGNHGLGFGDQRRLLASHRWTVLGFGGAATLATAMPGVNGLVLPVAVAGGTSLAIEEMGAELEGSDA